MQTNQAIFFDFENTSVSGLEMAVVYDFFSTRGEISECRIYAPLRMTPSLGPEATSTMWRLVPVSEGVGRNHCDIQIAVDAIELAFIRPDINTLLIASGDSDFVPLVQKLQAFGKRVVALASKEKLSCELYETVDEYLAIEELTQQILPIPIRCIRDVYWAVKLHADTRLEPACKPLRQWKIAISHLNEFLQRVKPGFRLASYGLPSQRGLRFLLTQLEEMGLCEAHSENAPSAVTFEMEKMRIAARASQAPARFHKARQKFIRKVKAASEGLHAT